MVGRGSGLGTIAIIAILLVATPAGFVEIGQAHSTSPDPVLTDVTVPDEITIGESFDVRVTATNRGSEGKQYSSISISAPTLEEPDDGNQISVESNTLPTEYVRTSGDRIYDTEDDGLDAEYALFEGSVGSDGTWADGEQHSLTVEFTPEQTGEFVVYVRATMTGESGETKYSDPSSSAQTDQQGFYVEKYTVHVRDRTEVDARITAVDQSSGTYLPGESVSADVTVENTGDVEHTFFVGYSAIGPDGTSFDNDDATGNVITLAPGAQRTVDLSWEVERDVSSGEYDIRTSVWKESDPDQLRTRLADERRDSAFTVAEGSIDAEVIDFSTDAGEYDSGESVPSTVTVENTGNVEHTFYVGYSARGPDGRFYDNNRSTHETVTVEPGERKATTVTWTVPGDARPGSYDLSTAVWEGRDDTDLVGELDDQRRRDAVTVATLSADQARLDVVSVNGNTKRDGAFPVSSVTLETITVAIREQDGTPVENLSPSLTRERGEVEFELVNENDGEYTFEPTETVGTGTLYSQFAIRLRDSSQDRTISVPMNDVSDPLPGPIRNWQSFGATYTVSVDGDRYRALLVTATDTDRSGWLIFTPDGELVSDPVVRRRAAKTATVARTFSNEPVFEAYLSEEYPDRLRGLLGLSYGLQTSIIVRDTSAQLLGGIASTYATGGASAVSVGGTQVATASKKQVAEGVARELSKEVLTQMREQFRRELEQELASDVLGTYRNSMRAAAHNELRESISQSERAGRLLKAHPDDEIWSYREAAAAWTAYNESMVDGILWSEVRVQTMPSGAPSEQLRAIGTNFAEGATGLPVTQLSEVFLSGEAGSGYRVAIRNTAGYRQSFARDAEAFREISPLIHRTVRERYGDDLDAPASGTNSTTGATIEIVSPPTGEYLPGDWANVTVEVTNQRAESARYFVGYSAATESDAGPLYFDNRDQTGSWVVLDAGETRKLEVGWRVQRSAPIDRPYDVIVATWSGFPRKGVARYDTARSNGAFRIGGEVSISASSLTAAEETTTGEHVTVTAGLTNDGRRSGEEVITVTHNGRPLRERIVHVGAGESEQVSFDTSFATAGTHELSVRGESVSVSVEKSANKAPDADIVAYRGDDGTVVLDASATRDPDDPTEELIYEFNVVDGPETPRITLEQRIGGTVRLSESGNYTFEVTVTDADGSADTDTAVLYFDAAGNATDDNPGPNTGPSASDTTAPDMSTDTERASSTETTASSATAPSNSTSGTRSTTAAGTPTDSNVAEAKEAVTAVREELEGTTGAGPGFGIPAMVITLSLLALLLARRSG